MPRINHRELRDRVQTQTQFDSPALRVLADQSTASGAGAQMFAVGAALQKLGGTVAEVQQAKKQKKEDDDYAKGKQLAQQKWLTGQDSPEAAALFEISEAARRGRDEIDGLRMADEWTAGVQAQLAELEPGDVNGAREVLQRFSQDFLAKAPEGGRATLTGALARMQPQVLAKFQVDSIEELDLQQKESATDLVRKGFRDRSMLSAEGLAKFEEYLNAPEFASLDKRERAAIIAKAAISSLESGEVNPDELLGVLDAYRPGGAPVFARFTDELENAAGAGRRVIAQREREAGEQRYAQLAFRMDDEAERGRLSDARILAYAKEIGRDDDPEFLLMWRNRNQAAVEKMEREAAAARERASKTSLLSLIASGDPRLVTYSPEQLGNAVNEGIRDAMGAGDSAMVQQLYRLSVERGYPINIVKNGTSMFDPSQPAAAKSVIAEYERLAAISPDHAIRTSDARFQGMYQAYRTLRDDLGQSEEQALATLASRQPNAEGVQDAVTKALRERPEIVTFQVSNRREASNRVARVAGQLMAYGGIDADAALTRANAIVKATTMEVNGRLLPSNHLPPNAGAMLTRIAQERKRSLVATTKGRYTEDDEITFMPVRGDRGQYVMVEGDSGAPVLDANGKPTVISPAKLTEHYRSWETNERATAVRRQQTLNALGIGDSDETVAAASARFRESAKRLRDQAKARVTSQGLLGEAIGVTAAAKAEQQRLLKLAKEHDAKAQAIDDAALPKGATDFLDFLRSTQ